MPTPEEIKAQITDTSKIVENTLKSVAAQIGDIFQDALSEADSITKIFGKDVEKQLKSLARATDKMIENQLKIEAGQASSKDIAKQILEYETKREVLQKRISNLMQEQPGLATQLQNQLNDVNAANKDYIDGLKEQEKRLEKIEDKIGALGKLAKGLNKIPILGNLINADKVESEMKKAADKGKSPFIAGFKEIGTSLKKGLTDPLTIITFIVNQTLNAEKQIISLTRSLVSTRGEAFKVREQFVEASRAINDTAITTDKLIEANFKLNEQLGINKIFSIGLNKEFVNLTQKVKISEEAAGGLAKMTISSGKAARQITINTVGAIEKIKQETKLRLDNRKILEATGKVSGQLLANFRANPVAIAEAIAKTQALGTTLEQTKAQGESLLNFESSIENELKAELITGKQMNLERARMAALMGDQKAVAEELSAQAVDFNTFSEMNVIAQKSLAEALGTSADALSDQLFKQQYLNKSKEEILALGGKEALQRMEQLTSQEKFNNAVEKLKDLLGNLVAGPLGLMLSVLSDMLQVVNLIGAPFRLIGNIINSLLGPTSSFGSILKGILFTTIAIMTFMSPMKALLSLALLGGTILGVEALLGKSKKIEDGFINPQAGTVISSAAGTFQTRPDDKILVGTNVSPSMNKGGSSVAVDLTPMIVAINEVRNAVNNLANRPSIINMDGKQVGSNLVQNSYKLA